MRNFIRFGLIILWSMTTVLFGYTYLKNGIFYPMGAFVNLVGVVGISVMMDYL